MCLFIEKFENSPINSNCFLIFNEQNKAIVIDPGTKKHEKLYNFIKKNNLTVEYCILTHGHFDHVLGTDDLVEKYDPVIILSEEALKYLSNSKKNLSVFHGQEFSFNAEKYILINDDTKIACINHELELYKTTGHTDSCISIKILDKLFVGDLMIKSEKTVTKLPTGNKELAIKSINKLLSLQDVNTIYGGHGDAMSINYAKNFFLS